MDEIKLQEEYINKIKKINVEKKLKYHIYTMGCSLNENDSEKIAGILESSGYIQTFDMNDADLIVFNTCCIRENAEEKLFGKLGEAKKQKEHKEVIVAVGGCMMQEDHVIQKLKKSYPFCDIIFGTHTLHKFPANLYELLKSKKKIKDIIDIDGKVYEGLPIKRISDYKALVTIMYGCDNFCSYCIVPYVRGRERSRKPSDILTEVSKLALDGYKEITLLGQNVNSYRGEKNGQTFSFAMLLEAVCKIKGIDKINFISPHPKDFTEDVIDKIAKNEKITRIIHLPIQSGSTKVLKDMNRKYSKIDYLILIEKMKKKIPEVAFSTDIIVGFPGETEEDFLDTLDVIDKVKFEQVYMFIYSPRIGTPAATKKQVEEKIKHERFNRLKKLVDLQIKENNKKYIGSKQKILIEGRSKNNKDMLTGRTDTNKIVILEGEDELIGKVIEVEIVSEHMWYLKGACLSKELM